MRQTTVEDTSFAPYGEAYGRNPGGWIQFTEFGRENTVQGANDSGLNDYLFRRYSSTQSRWISPDPAGMGAVDPTNPQTWNRYAYVANNPLRATDPLGLQMTVCGTCNDANGGGGLAGDSGDDLSNELMALTAWGASPGAFIFAQTAFGGSPDASLLLNSKFAEPGYDPTLQADITVYAYGRFFGREITSLIFLPPAEAVPGSQSYEWDAPVDWMQVFQQPVLQNAAVTMNDPRTIAAWYGASLLAGGGGAVAADLAQGTADSLLFGTRFQGNAALWNSSDFFRIGFSQVGDGQFTFRIGGEFLENFTGNPHIDLWPPSSWFGSFKP